MKKTTTTIARLILVVLILSGCSSPTPQTIKESGIKKEFNMQSHRDQVDECITTEMDAYPIHAIGKNEGAVIIRRYKDRTELLLFPCLVILNDNNYGGTNVEILLKQPYWNTQDLLEKYESFIKNCSKNKTG